MKSKLLAALAVTFALASVPAMAAGTSVSGSKDATAGATGTVNDTTVGASGSASGDANVNANTNGTDTTATGSISASGNLGVDISSAGTTAETQAMFFNTLTAEQQQTVRSACGDQVKVAKFTAQESAFCSAVVKQP